MFRRMANARRDALGKAVARLEVVAPPGGARHETIANCGLWPFVALACKHNLPIERVAQLAQITVAELRDPGGRTPQVIANRVAEVAFQHAGSGAAMEAAMTVEAGHFALIELLARTSPNVRQAVQLVCRYFPLVHDDITMTYEKRPQGVEHVRLVSPANYVVHHGYVELAFAVMMLSIRRETQQPAIEPLEVWFEHRAPVDRRAFETVLGPRVRFDMPEHHIVFDSKLASLPLARKNSEVHAAAVRAAVDLLRE
jgi:hypothetical protein